MVIKQICGQEDGFWIKEMIDLNIALDDSIPDKRWHLSTKHISEDGKAHSTPEKLQKCKALKTS